MNVVMSFGEYREDLDVWCSKNEAYYLTVKPTPVNRAQTVLNYFKWKGRRFISNWRS